MTLTVWQAPKTNVKNLNKHAALDLIRFATGGISRIELSRQIGLTRAALTAIVNDLIQAGLVRESAGQHIGGRNPINLEINPEVGRVLGIDIGSTHITIVLANYQAQVLAETNAPMDVMLGPDFCMNRLIKLIEDWLPTTKTTLTEITAAAVGVPGPVVSDTGIVGAPPIMPGWDKFPIRDWLEERLGCPVSLGNDAEFGALGEWAFGAGRGEKNLAYIKVGTGIGAGFLLDGQIYRGTTGSAGEIGHITLEENGPLCSCGNRGCLEAMAGGRSLAQRAREGVLKGRRTMLSEILPTDSLTAQDVINAARRGDLFSQQLITESGYHLGTAIAGLVNLINPEIIVIGGGVAQLGDLLLDPIRKTVKERSLLVSWQAVRISAAVLGRRSSALGAVAQALSMSLHRIAESN
ncbi:MAG TPA: ROK family transcriptional regulator [Bellilinea sp.]